ncbi:MAG: hypothetical protein ILA17_06295 [Ruminococcus sp.]|nr:hypothetical protein [Ruminiclostridium sp.]MBP1537460.1 hypothetical protein [Ruminococcus sp.]
MAVDYAALRDLRTFIKRRVSYMRYRVGDEFFQTPISNAELLESGVVRVSASLVPGHAVEINRVELYNHNGDLWAHQDCAITIDNVQTGVLYWFDFTVKEKEGTTSA